MPGFGTRRAQRSSAQDITKTTDDPTKHNQAECDNADAEDKRWSRPGQVNEGNREETEADGRQQQRRKQRRTQAGNCLLLCWLD
mmetsp:Transcript_869/g.2813  ORF Transcript_869/g.2813 Transcript_869/m.2813 type:complete len:84 (+) Transcript_869:749-1000(+)